MCQEPYPYFHDRSSLGSIVLDQLKARTASALYSKYDIRSARRIPKIATNSAFSKSEVFRVYGRNSTVVYPGFDEKILGMKTGERVPGRVLSVSPTAPRKGFQYSLRAFTHLASNGLADAITQSSRHMFIQSSISITLSQTESESSGPEWTWSSLKWMPRNRKLNTNPSWCFLLVPSRQPMISIRFPDALSHFHQFQKATLFFSRLERNGHRTIVGHHRTLLFRMYS